MDDVGAQIHQHLHVELHRLVVVLVALVEDRTGLERLPLLAYLQTLVDGEVASRDEVDYLGAILLVA